MAILDKGKGRANEQEQTASTATANGAPAAATAIDADLFKRIQPGEYLARFLAQDYRPDGRKLDEFRDTSIDVGSISSADGSALVRMGQTTVLCGITAQIATPDILAANQGFLVVNVDLPPMCSSKFRPGPPSDEAQVLSSRIRNIALSSSLLPLKSLCIKPAQAAWVVYADLMCISYDGNITDAALLALVAALKNARIPRAVWDEDLEEAIATEDEPVPLHVRSTILSASYALSEDGRILSDPTSFEAPLCSTHLSIALNEQGKISHVWQAGPGQKEQTAPAKLLIDCLAKTRKRWTELKSILEQTLQ